MPQKFFAGQIRRTSGALDPATRTLIAEVRLQNPQKLLRPGQSAQVGVRVNSDNTLHFQPVTVGRDFGQVIEVTSGLRANDKILATPADTLQEKQHVKPVAAKPAKNEGN